MNKSLVFKGLSLGIYPILSLALARTNRDEAKRLLADGVDPSVQKKLDNIDAAVKARTTFKEIADEYYETLVDRGLATSTLRKKRWYINDLAKQLHKAKNKPTNSPNGWRKVGSQVTRRTAKVRVNRAIPEFRSRKRYRYIFVSACNTPFVPGSTNFNNTRNDQKVRLMIFLFSRSFETQCSFGSREWPSSQCNCHHRAAVSVQCSASEFSLFNRREVRSAKRQSGLFNYIIYLVVAQHNVIVSIR